MESHWFYYFGCCSREFLGSALAARFVGQSWRDSLTIGALMNTRGLMELIVLNIGLELKVLTQRCLP
jgi:Kef-type K+ transport system membrane component KefB